ncbi:sporulation protein [Dactylosporangium sp. AC04546]|uniref:sporulation protein n=1 Tax=Dactylosporangium sp. AC04546 TaxID=2862460 RepID=UPI001EDF4BED|nr:sporulation protein [Dactylosporangium sp. AC04546]WVK79453.1 sporulation protein [Dactylosporangium sp. AC04546]
MVFKKMLAAFGVGGPSVDTVLDTPTAQPGGFIDGQVHVRGGDSDALIEHIVVALVTRVEIDGDEYDHEAGVELTRIVAADHFRVPAGQTQSIPFRLPVPWETPITSVYGQHLRGMAMGVRTELEVAGGRDKGDLDPVAVAPLPVQQAILDAFATLGFRFKQADVEHGYIHGVSQHLPIYQEIEFWPAPQYSGAINEVELTFVADPSGVQVILEFDKRSGMFASGHDAYSRFHISHDAAGSTDWAAVVDGWVRQAADRYASHLPSGAYGHGSYGGHHDHGYGHDGHGHRSGPGMGAVVAAGAAGVVGGLVAGEILEEVFEDEDEDEDDENGLFADDAGFDEE